MVPRDSGVSENDEYGEALKKVEERVKKVQHLEPFHFSQREDGRFQCELAKPIVDLEPEEIREALTVLETLADVLRKQLEDSDEA